MLLEEIKKHVDDGKYVFWTNDNYRVVKGKAGYFIQCVSNGHCIGLTHLDNVTMNGNPHEFFIKMNEGGE